MKKVTGKKICKWCGSFMKYVEGLPENNQIKFGICKSCLAKEMAKLQHCKNG